MSKQKGKPSLLNKEVSLLSQEWELVKKVGKGNYSQGLHSLLSVAFSLQSENNLELFVQLPLVGRVKLALELLLEDKKEGRELAEAVLLELEDLEFENLHKEAEAEGTLENAKGAWIV